MIDVEKTVLLQTQKIIFLGLVLDFGDRTLHFGASGHFQQIPRAFPPRQICAVQVVSTAVWTDGFCHPGGLSWPPPHEGVPVVGGLMRAGSRASRCTTGDGHTQVRNSQW